MKITNVNGQMYIDDQLVKRIYFLNLDVSDGKVKTIVHLDNLLIVDGFQVVKVKLTDNTNLTFDGYESQNNNINIENSNGNVIIQGTNGTSNIKINHINIANFN